MNYLKCCCITIWTGIVCISMIIILPSTAAAFVHQTHYNCGYPVAESQLQSCRLFRLEPHNTPFIQVFQHPVTVRSYYSRRFQPLHARAQSNLESKKREGDDKEEEIEKVDDVDSLRGRLVDDKDDDDDTSPDSGDQRTFDGGANSAETVFPPEMEEHNDKDSNYLRPASSEVVVQRRKSKRKAKHIDNDGYESYKVLDNRDSLPFAVVQVVPPPDPFTQPEQFVKLKQQPPQPPRQSSNKGMKKKRRDDGSNTIVSKLYASNNDRAGNSDDGDTLPLSLLGEYQLDRHTTTGDLLCIGELQYRVIQHRCLYKYVGGRRFEMVKKILHVKEINRLQTEEYLMRQFRKSE